MKTYRVLGLALLALCSLLLAPGTLLGQELPIATPVDPATLATPADPGLPAPALLIAVVVPLLIAGLKKLFPKIPGALLPVLAPVLGGIIEAIITSLGHDAGGLVTGAVAGAAGTGVREIVDQNRKRLPGASAAAALCFLCGLLFVTPGCAGFSNRQQDRSVVIHPDGTREERDILSRQRANTLLDSKSALAQLKAQQTDKTQSIGIGTLNQESTAPQVGQMLGLDILAKIATSPEGQKLILRALGVPIP